MLHQQV